MIGGGDFLIDGRIWPKNIRENVKVFRVLEKFGENERKGKSKKKMKQFLNIEEGSETFCVCKILEREKNVDREETKKRRK